MFESGHELYGFSRTSRQMQIQRITKKIQPLKIQQNLKADVGPFTLSLHENRKSAAGTLLVEIFIPSRFISVVHLADATLNDKKPIFGSYNHLSLLFFRRIRTIFGSRQTILVGKCWDPL